MAGTEFQPDIGPTRLGQLGRSAWESTVLHLVDSGIVPRYTGIEGEDVENVCKKVSLGGNLPVPHTHGLPAAVWDDDGHFRVYDRAADAWDEDLLHALGKK